MILQSLVTLYESLVAKGELNRPGWSPVKVSWGLEIDEAGTIRYLTPLVQEAARGKKTVLVPQVKSVPIPVKRTVGVEANFLCDNSSYVLGIDAKGKPERALQCFQAFRAKHHQLLDGCAHPAAIALLRFLDGWKPEEAANNLVLSERMTELIKGGNIVFSYKDAYLQDIEELRQVWQLHFDSEENAVTRQCLVTGREAPVQVLHPSIKGVPGAQSSGASLVSFNASSLESYGCDGGQGLNAPVSTYAAFAYGAALNYLLSNERCHLYMGETTVVYWTEDGEEGYAGFFSNLFGSNTMDDGMLEGALKAVAEGKNANWNGMPLNPDNRFYILGLSPNAARLSVRFFLCNSFGTLMQNVLRHQEDLQIVKPAYDTWNELSLWWLLRETFNRNAREKKNPHAQMEGDLMRSILLGLPYPETLFERVQLRIRAERDVTRGRAAIIKAYLLRCPHFANKEVLTVELNQETKYPPYLLGRLFAVLEALQQQANPGINATIKDRYFSSACATPAIVFPTLIKLAQAHLKKLDDGWRIYFDKQIGEILSAMTETYPARLPLQDQGVFQLGYYHQTQRRYQKKEEQENG